VTEPTRIPPGVDALIRSLVGGSGDEDRDQRASTFARGLALGALVGAAIAGSTIWQRRQAQRIGRGRPAEPPDPTAVNGVKPAPG
jgi:hypothetical protein